MRLAWVQPTHKMAVVVAIYCLMEGGQLLVIFSFTAEADNIHRDTVLLQLLSDLDQSVLPQNAGREGELVRAVCECNTHGP